MKTEMIRQTMFDLKPPMNFYTSDGRVIYIDHPESVLITEALIAIGSGVDAGTGGRHRFARPRSHCSYRADKTETIAQSCLRDQEHGKDHATFSDATSGSGRAFCCWRVCLSCFGQAPITNGLVARWTGDGNAKDSAGHDDGKISGGLTYVPGPTAAQAFHFGLHGTEGQIATITSTIEDRQIVYPNVEPRAYNRAGGRPPQSGEGSAKVDFGSDIGNFGTRDFTIAFWLKTDSKYAPEAFLAKRAACDGSGGFWEIQIGSQVTKQAPPGFLIMQFFEADRSAPLAEYEDRYEFFSRHPVNDDQWHHIAWIRQSTSSGSVSYLLYMDGMLDTSKVYPEAVDFSNQSPLVLGQSLCQCCDGTRPYSGAAAELQLFSHALSADEILAIYKAAKPAK